MTAMSANLATPFLKVSKRHSRVPNDLVTQWSLLILR
jgi:hypothetical protein